MFLTKTLNYIYRYSGQLKNKKSMWVPEHDFHFKDKETVSFYIQIILWTSLLLFSFSYTLGTFTYAQSTSIRLLYLKNHQYLYFNYFNA